MPERWSFEMMASNHHCSGPVTVFQERSLPERATSGVLSKRARGQEFASLTEPEVAAVETAYLETFQSVD